VAGSALLRRLVPVAPYVRYAAILLPLGVLAHRVDPVELPHALGRVGLGAFAVALSFQLAAVLTGVYRWRVLLRAYGATPDVQPSLLALIRHTLVGFYFALLPSGFVGEVVRAHRTTGVLPKPADAYLVIGVDRISASIGLLVVCLLVASEAATLAPAAEVFGAGLQSGLVVALVLTLAALGAMVVLPHCPRIIARLGRLPWIGVLARSAPRVNGVGPIAWAIALSIAVELLAMAAIAAVVLPIGGATPVAELLMAVPVILLLTVIPLLPGALGQRELAFVLLLGRVGVSATDATAASLATLAVALAIAALGGSILLLERARPPG
jgi:uncharacterized membrane protein YbhN (UPF0104 family)